MKEPKHNPILYVYIACCCFYLGLFKEAKEYGEKGKLKFCMNLLVQSKTIMFFGKMYFGNFFLGESALKKW